MNSDPLAEIIIQKLDELSMDLLNPDIEDSDREHSSFTICDIAKFIKDIALENESADLLLKSTQLEKLARKISDQELDRYQTDFEELAEDHFLPPEEWVEQRKARQNLVGLCDEKILNSEAFVLDLSAEISIFKKNESAFYTIGTGHKIDNYLSRQNTQYRIFLLCKNRILNLYTGIGDSFPSSDDFEQIFEEAKINVHNNAKKYMDKHIKQLAELDIEVA